MVFEVVVVVAAAIAAAVRGKWGKRGAKRPPPASIYGGDACVLVPTTCALLPFPTIVLNNADNARARDTFGTLGNAEDEGGLIFVRDLVFLVLFGNRQMVMVMLGWSSMNFPMISE